jgi:hypothetical protein
MGTRLRIALHIQVHILTSSPTNLSHEPPLAYVGTIVVPFVSNMERKW